MKKSAKNKTANRHKASSQASKKRETGTRSDTSAGIDMSKRNFLSMARSSAIGSVVVGAGGFYLYSAYQADLEERDLSKIGNGKPSIVQIHDPECQLCRALQKETRNALSNFEPENFEYLVANIRTSKGREFANTHNVPHVTLLLFNKHGRLKQVLQGVKSESELTGVFQNHIGSAVS